MNEKVVVLLLMYDKELETQGVGIARAADLFPGDFCHLRWMIREVLTRASQEEWSERKVCRWLGFIQGSLWATRKMGILTLRDQCRDLYSD